MGNQTASRSRCSRRLTGWLVLLPVLFAAVPASADSVADPTRPPPVWLAAQPGAQADAAAEDSSAGLHVLVVGRTRKFAVIDGHIVRPGDTVNGSKVLAIKRDELVVQDGDASKALKLAPGVEKKFVTSRPAGKVAKSASKRKVLLNGNGENK